MSPPLRVVLPGDTETPVSAFLKLAGSARQAFLLESVEPGERVGRFSFIGVRPRRVLRTQVGKGGGPFDLLDEYVRTTKGEKHEGYPPFTGGLVGFIGYDAVKRLEPRVPLANPDELGFPEATFFDVDTVVAFDNVRRELQLLTQLRPEDGSPRAQQAKARRRLAALERALSRPLRPPRPKVVPAPVFKPRTPRAGFLRAVDRAREYVAAGDVQQVVVAQRFDARTDLEGFELYRALRRINPSPFMFFFRDGERELIGASPERLVEVRGRHVSVRPIAGTRKRGATAELDLALEAELLADPKEAAEHVMLVDLGRNDVGRVATLGSVKVDAYRVVERYSHVLHLVSQVHGELAKGKSSIDAVRAAFPAGTLSGAPKVRAMEIIDELEPARRGPYGGAVGYVDASGDVDFAITIRTFMRTPGLLSAQAGAGIVHDSVSALEYEETLNKAGALFLAAAQAARGMR
jgi:anthranilate synthase component 1